MGDKDDYFWQIFPYENRKERKTIIMTLFSNKMTYLTNHSLFGIKIQPSINDN